MNKKYLILGLSLLLSVGIVYALIGFEEGKMIPQNGDVIDGNATTLFEIEVNNTFEIFFGVVVIEGIEKWQQLNCYDLGGNSICNRTLDLTAMPDGDYDYYFMIGEDDFYYSPPSAPLSNFYFTIDRIPLAPTGLAIISSDEESLQVDWDNNTELDIFNYLVYISNTSEINISDEGTYDSIDISTTSDYTINDLEIDDVRYCVVTAVDNGGKESEASSEVNGTVKDATPPDVPIITPNSSSQVDMTNPTITLEYNEEVTLDIITAGEIMVTFDEASEYTWNPNFRDNTTYIFTLNATDTSGNTRSDIYVITVRTGALFNIEIKGMEHASYDFFPIKTSILAGDYVLFGVNANFYTFTGAEKDTGIKFKMSDWVSDEFIIDDMDAIAFCEDDYENQNFIEGRDKYDIENDYDDGQDALHCTDNTPTVPDVEFTFYVRADIPPDVKPGTYEFDYGINTYQEE